MKYEDQVACIVDIFNNPDNFLNALNRDNFLDNSRDEEICKKSASLHDELESNGIYFSMFVFNTNDFELREKVLQFIALTCLHADEKQAHRLVENCSSFNLLRRELTSIPIDIKKINIDHIKNNDTALKLFDDLFRIEIKEWINLVIESDDAQLAKMLIKTPNAVVDEVQLKNELGENPNIRKAFFGTSQYTLKDLFSICTMPFTHNFDCDVFQNKFDPSCHSNLFAKYGEHIFAHCFQSLKNAGRVNSQPDIEAEQEAAMTQVVQALLAEGIDWYKPWLASAEKDCFPALIDLADVEATSEEKILSFLNDERIKEMPDYPIFEAGRRVMFSIFPAETVCQVLKKFEDPDKVFDLFYRETKNPVYLEQIKSPEKKRHILSDELSM